METNFDHNKLLKKIARNRLIEFQPSSWGKGSYLNIGVDLNFYPRNHLAFSYGYREKDLTELTMRNNLLKL